ncbi:putative mitochondrial chaperone BCS1-B [Diplonema papillatum]|nr:putative mitochondrial chaperone BCS1-B [Diplonema papillatum]|eukprot:gene11694-18035_t
MDTLLTTVQSNPYFHAGAGLYGVGAVLMVARVGWRGVREYGRRKWLTSVEVTNRDPAFHWVMDWVAKHHGEAYLHKSVFTSDVVVHANNSISASLRYVPSPGIHYFVHQGRFYWVNRRRQVEKTTGTDVLETMTVTTLGANWTAIDTILKEAADDASVLDRDRTIIYTSSGAKWLRFQDPRSKKPLESVVLPGDKKEKILHDIRGFLENREWYERMGIPYRRGYLLHGPPGCGKSSLVLALAGELDMAICMLSLSNRHLDDEGLNVLLNTAPQRSIVLLEDVDRAFSAESRVTVSGVLNSIDGVVAQEGRLLFLTTNHVGRLDEALIRPGRCDVKLHVPNSTPLQQKQLFLRFFPSESLLADEFCKALAGTAASPPSMAALQGHLFSHRESPEDAVANVADFLYGTD